ncbi:MAG: NADP-dependent oxidoreductase [bacterium]|nr:NADP-dependent oxidoreductase [bacterium]
MPETNQRVLLRSRPRGWVTPDNFDFDEIALAEPAEGEVLVRNVYLSVDPYMRGRMNAGRSYIPPFEVGEPLQGGVVGQVAASCIPELAEGDWVSGVLGWETFSVTNGEGLHKVQPDLAPLSYHLGILGMPGMTAYVGLIGVGELQEGERVFVTAASGAVGSVVGQIAKNLGCYVAGSAGSDEKVAFLTDELGFDAALNYKTIEHPIAAVRKACPQGIDVHFENVGGPMFEAAIFNMRERGRIALCGMIADYNAEITQMPPGPRGLVILIGRSIRMQGFIVFNYPELCAEWVAKGAEWLGQGKLEYRESVAEGLENAPAAFIGMLKGENFGKQIVRLADE